MAHFSYALHLTLPQYTPVAVEARLNTGKKIIIYNFEKISCLSIHSFKLTGWSFISTAARALWARFRSSTWFSVAEIWTTNSSHCGTFTVLQTFWSAAWHLTWQRAFTKIYRKFKIWVYSSLVWILTKKNYFEPTKINQFCSIVSLNYRRIQSLKECIHLKISEVL